MKLRPSEIAAFEKERAVYRELIAHIHRDPRPVIHSGLQLVCIGNAGGADNLVHGRPSGGMLLQYAGRTMLIDPGANSIAYLVSLGINPYRITDVLASHTHNDHVGDLSSAVAAATNLGLDDSSDSHIVVCPPLIDYRTSSSTRFGFTLPAYAWRANVTALYWRDVEVERLDGTTLRSRTTITVGDGLKVSAAEGRHGQVMVTGFVVDTPAGRIGYTSDTEYFEGLAHWYRGVDVLWMNMNTLALDSADDIVPESGNSGFAEPVHNHLGYVGVCELIERVRPSTALVSHMGAQLLDQPEAIEGMLRERFSDRNTSIHCPRNGDAFHFEGALARPPGRRRFTL